MRASGKDRWPALVVTVCGLGHLPVAPGTWGTLGAVLVHALVAGLAGTAGHPVLLPAFAFLSTAACVVYGPWAERFYGQKDPPPVVIDEVAGYFLAVSFFPARPQFWIGLAAFLLFRFFDIVKPFPARGSQRLPDGWGIVADDLIAGGYTALAIALIYRLVG